MATDGSEQSEAAVAEIVRQHLPDGSEVRVVSVVEPAYLTGSYAGEGMDINVYLEIEKMENERSNAAVEKAATDLRAGDESRKLNVTTKVLSGSPKHEILAEAEAYGADLIVLGSHGYGTIDRFLLGSVSQAVALHAKCSVEIVRRAKSGKRR